MRVTPRHQRQPPQVNLRRRLDRWAAHQVRPGARSRGPYEVVVEKNVGEKFRNTGLTDDSASCASLVSGLGADADGGDWAIYPTDMDRQLYTLFRPAEFKEGEKYPVITWGNGTCSQPLLFEPLLGHLASHGFVIIATNWRWVAGGVFYDACELCSDPTWQIKSANL
jgi:hypothetical protein